MSELLSSRSMPRSSASLAITLVRVAAAGILVIHGIARAKLGIVDDFSQAFEAWGFPFGFILAWTVTVVEIVGGVALAVGFSIRPLALWFVAQLLAGIVLVHGREGWFVVGAGRNGVEFSVLLIVCLIAVALSAREGYRVGGRAGSR